MAIVSGDLEFRLSGGASNTDEDLSLGGVISTTEVDTVTTIGNLFDDADVTESTDGSVKYRCIYLRCDHATLIPRSALVWINSNTPSTDTTYAIGLGTSSLGGTEQTIADEDTAPSGITFSEAAVDESTGLSIGDMVPVTGDHKALWIRRTIDAGAGVYSDDTATITFKCESDNV